MQAAKRQGKRSGLTIERSMRGFLVLMGRFAPAPHLFFSSLFIDGLLGLDIEGLLEGNISCFPFNEAQFWAYPLEGALSLRISWAEQESLDMRTMCPSRVAPAGGLACAACFPTDAVRHRRDHVPRRRDSAQWPPCDSSAHTVRAYAHEAFPTATPVCQNGRDVLG